jgi:cytochrome c2
MKASTVNACFFAAIGLTLFLLLVWVYKGLRDEHIWHHGHAGTYGPAIANITVNLGGTPVQEHCQTCHPDGRPAGSSTSSAPVVHPDISPHSIYDLGCTACHLGEGMAADIKISHGRIGNEVRRVLAGVAVQSTCYRCHELKPLKGAELAYLGSKLFSDNACALCHATGEARGAIYGPDLSDAGSFLSLPEMQAVIENPKAALPNSIMPKFSLSPEERTAISYFLKSRIRDPYYETPMVRMARKREAESEKNIPAPLTLRGSALLKNKKCLACHKLGEDDGQIAPDLTYTAYMRNTDYVRTFLKDPGKEIPGAVMPVVHMSGDEEGAIIRLLEEKRPIHLHGGMSPRGIYMMLCQRCHAAQGDGLGDIQPNLADFPRVFRDNRAFFASIPDERIVRSIEKGIPGTSMPPYGEMFGRATVNSLVDLLFRIYVRANRSDKKIPVPPDRPAVLPKIEAVRAIYERECSRCHGVEGTGKGPDYLKYLPRPRDLTNRPYFTALNDDRIAVAIAHGIPGTGMKGFEDRLKPEQVWGLVGTVRAFSARKEAYDDGQ